VGGQRLVRSVTGVEPRRTVNPDEAVSLGAPPSLSPYLGHYLSSSSPYNPDEAVSLGATSLFSEHHSSALLFLNLSFHHAVYVGGVL